MVVECTATASGGSERHPLSYCAAPRAQYAIRTLPLHSTANVDGELPPLSDMLADSASLPPLASRLA